MTNDALLYVNTAAIVVAAVALLFQAGLLLSIHRAMQATRAQVDNLAGRVQPILEKTERTVEEVSSKVNDVVDLTRKQLVRTDEILAEATARARAQMDRIELVLDDTMNRFQETSATLQSGIMRPIREINGVVAGIGAALSFLWGGNRTSVEKATHDEEMFI